MNGDKIHIAYSKSRKSTVPAFHVRAYVGIDSKRRHAQSIRNADTFEEAKLEIMAYINETYWRDGLNPPTEIVEHGKLSAILIDNWIF